MKSSIKNGIQALRAGEPILLTQRDAFGATRGSLILAAENATPAGVNLLALEGRGVVCVGIDAATAQRLDLSPMVPTADADDMLHSVSTISIDAAEGITTGISAADRAVTLRLLTADSSTADDFVRPGHLFPYVAHKNGVLGRPETPEAAVDLMQLAGLKSAGAFCGVLDGSGQLADATYLEELAARTGLTTVTMDDLVEHRLLNGRYLERSEKEAFESNYGRLNIERVHDTVHDDTHYIVTGDLPAADGSLVYVHRACVKGDVFSARNCTSRENLETALQQVAQEGGTVIYLGTRTPKERALIVAAQLIAATGERTVRILGSESERLAALLEQVGVVAADSRQEGAQKEAMATRQ